MYKDIIDFATRLPKKYLRGLVSFLVKVDDNIEHIGTGFLCIKSKEDHVLYLVTAKHVIANLLSDMNAYCCFSLEEYDDKKELFNFVGLSKFKFESYDEYDSVYAIIGIELLKDIFGNSKVTPFILMDSSKSYDEKSSIISVIGFTANENIRKINLQEYKRKWHSINTTLSKYKINTITEIKDAIFLDFNRKDTIRVNNDCSIEDLAKLPTQGNHTALDGMSGSPCIQYEIYQGEARPRVFGILVEHDNTPPANGRFLIVSPIEKMLG